MKMWTLISVCSENMLVELSKICGRCVQWYSINSLSIDFLVNGHFAHLFSFLLFFFTLRCFLLSVWHSLPFVFLRSTWIPFYCYAICWYNCCRLPNPLETQKKTPSQHQPQQQSNRYNCIVILLTPLALLLPPPPPHFVRFSVKIDTEECAVWNGKINGAWLWRQPNPQSARLHVISLENSLLIDFIIISFYYCYY